MTDSLPPIPTKDHVPTLDQIVAALSWLGVNLEEIIAKLARRTPLGAIAADELGKALWAEIADSRLRQAFTVAAEEILKARQTGVSEPVSRDTDLA